MQASRTKWIVTAIVLAAALVGTYVWNQSRIAGPGEGFISANGRIEATEVDIATRLPGRLETIFVSEGSFVEAGQPLARMQVDSLIAQRAEAEAYLQQAKDALSSQEAVVAARISELEAAKARVAQYESELNLAQQRLARSETLARQGATPQQTLDDHRTALLSTRALLTAAQAQVTAASAAVDAARAQLQGARSAVKAAQATVERIQTDIDDSTLKAPRSGRVQYLIAQPGEVLGAGGKIMNLVDLSDVYMTFFLPETVAGRIALRTPVHLVLDAAPEYVIPAEVSFVSSVAQFTPKTVETASERQKLMFRVRARIDRELLRKHLRQVKTGLPGVAWIRLDDDVEWPEQLRIRVPE